MIKMSGLGRLVGAGRSWGVFGAVTVADNCRMLVEYVVCAGGYEEGGDDNEMIIWRTMR